MSCPGELQKEIEAAFFRAVKFSVGGQPARVQQHIDAWRQGLARCADREKASLGLADMEIGYRTYFEGDLERLPTSYPNVVPSLRVYLFITLDFATELWKGNMHVSETKPDCVVRLATVKKDADDVRIVRDFSIEKGDDVSLNSGIPQDKKDTVFPLLSDFVSMAMRFGRGGFIFRIDGKSYYRQFPMHPDERRQLGYWWLGFWIVDDRLPFGIASATQNVQRTSELICEICDRMTLPSQQDLWRQMKPYIDDFIGGGKTLEEANVVFRALLETMEWLGIVSNDEKLEPPARVQKVVGFIFDLPNQTVSVPAEKIEKALSQIDRLLSNTVTEKAPFESCLGLLCWMSQCIFPARSFLRRLYWELEKFHGKASRQLSEEARKDLRWWKTYTKYLNGVPFEVILGSDPSDVLHVYTDASDTGMGAWWDGNWFELQYRDLPPSFPNVRYTDIAVREGLAVAIAVNTWAKQWRTRYVYFWVDNETVRYGLENRTTRARDVMPFVRYTSMMAITFHSRFFSFRLASEENVLADALSRQKWDVFRERVKQGKLDAGEVSPLIENFWCW